MPSPVPNPPGPRDTRNGEAGLSACTRTRLLEAAGEVFAERGFRDATVREICTRAGANIAAVNYYFQGKEGLYAQVVNYAQTCMHAAYPITVDHNAPAEDRLVQFVRAFVQRVVNDDRPAWHTKLMAREMVEPTAALDSVVAHTIRPTFALLSSIITGLWPQVRPDQLGLAASSIVGQCLMHRNCRPVLERLFPDRAYGHKEIAALANHIAQFSLAGIRALRDAESAAAENGTEARSSLNGAATPQSPAQRRARR
jgi:AcrR family transcriptional regulator